MKRTLLKYLTATLVIVVVGSLGVKLYQKYSAKMMALKTIQSQFPKVEGTTLAGKAFSLRSLPTRNATIIVLFNPFCEHCDYEADQIRQYNSALSQVRVVMISDEKIANIRAFQAKHALLSMENLDFVHMDTNRIFSTFGTLNIPQTYIYDASGKLRHIFKGEVKMDQILQML